MKISPWKNKNNIGRLVAFVILIVSSVVMAPGLGVWVGCLLLAKAWPTEEEYMMTVGFGEKKTERAAKVEAHKIQGFYFWDTITFGFGSPEEAGEDEGIDWEKTPYRLSSIINLVVSLVFAWLIVLLPLENILLAERIPAWGIWWEIPFFLVNTLFFYVNLQQLASTARAKKDQSISNAVYPPVQLDLAIKDDMEKSDFLSLALKGFMFAVPTGILAAILSQIAGFNILLSIPAVILMLLAGVLYGYWQLSMPIVHEHFEYILGQKESWMQRWEFLPAYKGVSPQYIFEENSPQDGITHKSITFGVQGGEAGVKPFMDEKVIKGLMTALATDTVLIGTWPKQTSGAREEDTRQEGAFKVVYPLQEGISENPEGGPEDQAVSIGSKYILKKDVDSVTRSFYCHAAFQAAFRALKLPQPIFVSATLKTGPKKNDESGSRSREENVIIETKWNIEDSGLTYEKLRSSTLDLQNELGLKWLRIGRRADNVSRKEDAKPDKHISIVFSIDGYSSLHPATNYTSAREEGFNHSLEWAWQMTSLKMPELFFLDNKVIANKISEDDENNNESNEERGRSPRSRSRSRRSREKESIDDSQEATKLDEKTTKEDRPRRRPRREETPEEGDRPNRGRRMSPRNIERKAPAIQIMSWRLPEGTKYEDIAKHTDAIQEKMGVPWLRISQPTIDFGETAPANIVLFYYGVDYKKEKVKFTLLKHEEKVKSLDWIHTLRQSDWRNFGVQIEKIIDHSAKKNKKLLEIIWHLPQNLTYIEVLKSRDKIAEKFGTPFFEIYRRSVVPKTDSWVDDSYVSFVFGEHPGKATTTQTTIAYENVNPKSAKYIDAVIWGSSFKKVELIDTDGTVPKVIGNQEKPLGVTVTTFEKVGKLSEEDFERRLPNLKTTLQVKHLKIDYAKEANTFTIEHAPIDPLSRNFDYDDYKDVLLLPEPPIAGKGKIEFGLGIGSTGEIVEMDFEGSPHICIGASSGSGKSYLLRAILLTWMHNNDPDKDLWLLMIEPKKGLEGYAIFPHVKCFVGNDTPAYMNVPEFTNEETGIQEIEPLIIGSSDIYDWLTEEMKRRELVYKRYEQEWGIRIEKLPEARQAAIAHMKENGLDDHELFMPFIVLVAEEAPQFMRELRTGGSVGKQKAGMVADIRRISEAVSQRARATGIILLNVSQNYKNELFPIEVKNNSRSVGLTTNTPRASINIWGDDTLHNLGKPGRGIKNDPDSGDLVDFRAFFVPMGEIEEKDGEQIVMRDYFAENLSHLEKREKPLNGWDPVLTDLYKPKYAVLDGKKVMSKGVPQPSSFILDEEDDEEDNDF